MDKNPFVPTATDEDLERAVSVRSGSMNCPERPADYAAPSKDQDSSC